VECFKQLRAALPPMNVLVTMKFRPRWLERRDSPASAIGLKPEVRLIEMAEVTTNKEMSYGAKPVLRSIASNCWRRKR
jgi:hypothetical protein